MITNAQDVLEKFGQLPAIEKKKVVSSILRESLEDETPDLTGGELTSGGKVRRVGESRVSLDSVIYAFQEGASAEEIALRFPTLELKQIYSVINFYLQNQAEMEEYLSAQQKRQAELKQQVESRFPPEGIRQKLLERSQNKR